MHHFLKESIKEQKVISSELVLKCAEVAVFTITAFQPFGSSRFKEHSTNVSQIFLQAADTHSTNVDTGFNVLPVKIHTNSHVVNKIM